MYVCMYLCMYVYIYLCMYVCIYVCMYLSISLNPNLCLLFEHIKTSSKQHYDSADSLTWTAACRSIPPLFEWLSWTKQPPMDPGPQFMYL